MISFGQKIKKLRTDAGYSQAYVAEHIGVSTQSISNWECDNTMPDISQIVPLAGILSVSTDFLLGVGMDEKADKEKLEEKIDYVWASYSVKEKHNNADILVSDLYKEYLRKYPMDYEVKFKCALALHDYYKVVVVRKKFEESKNILDDVYNQSEKLLQSVINNAKELDLVIAAGKIRVEHLLMKGNMEEAERVANMLPEQCGTKSEMLGKIYEAKNDKSMAVRSKLISNKTKCLNYVFGLCSLANNSEDAIKYLKEAEQISKHAIENYMEVTALKVNDYINMPYCYLITAYTMQSNNYLKLNEWDNAFAALENATEIACEMYKWVKQRTSDELILEDYIYFAKHTPHWSASYSGLFESENNEFANSSRFKKCEEKIGEILKQ